MQNYAKLTALKTPAWFVAYTWIESGTLKNKMLSNWVVACDHATPFRFTMYRRLKLDIIILIVVNQFRITMWILMQEVWGI